MKKTRLMGITSWIVSIAMLMSCEGFVFADETESDPNAEETVLSESDYTTESSAVAVEESLVDIEENEVSETESTEEVENQEENTDVEYELFEEMTVEETVVIDNGYDSNYLAGQFILDSIDPSFHRNLRSYDYISQLTEDDAIVINALYPQIYAIANGQRMSTEITIDDLSYSFTASDLGLANLSDSAAVRRAVAEHIPIDQHSIMIALMGEYPYEMYWYDKTEGTTFSYSLNWNSVRATVSNFTFRFTVADEYQDSTAQTPKYAMNSIFGVAINAASTNVLSIINTYAGLDDYNKLLAYKTWICDHVTYNYDAADISTNTPYGNPWQLIWVFDGDDNTNVVCEGYAKAFQFLCDESTFLSDDIYAISVYGVMGENHMWNVVHMDDGNNYLVDVTNCDSGHDLFLVGATGSVASGYIDVNHNYSYIYDNDLFTVYPSEDLTLAAVSYEPSGNPDPDEIEIDETNFPDDNFRSYISSNFDADSSGSLSESELEAVTYISVSSGTAGISDLTGIEYFTALQSLSCYNNSLTNLDLSRNTALEYINCSGTGISNLDVSGLTQLKKLYCDNNDLSSLDISSCLALEELYCNDNNLIELDVSNNPNLKKLMCNNNSISTLDVSNNSLITDLYCNNNELTTLDVSNNIALYRLICYSNSITELNLDQNASLGVLDCSINNIASLEIDFVFAEHI